MAGEHATDEATARRGFFSWLRRWPWIACGTLAGLLGSAVFVSVVPPRYAGLAVVVPAEPLRSPISRPDTPDDAEARSQSLASLDVARAAVDRLRLAQDPEFRGDDAPGRFLSRLTVRPVAGSRAIAITFEGPDPEIAARAANAVAAIAVLSLNEASARSVHAVETWLAKTIEDARARAALAEAKVEAARPAPAADAERQDDLDAKLSAARAAEAAASGKATELRRLARDGRPADARPSVADESLRRLIDQRAALAAEIADASRTLLPLHPRMKDLAAQLAAVDGQIREAAEREARASDSDARRAAGEADALAAELAERSRAAAAPAALHAAEAEAQTAREELASYQQMAREEARTAAEAESGGARILQRAEAPRAPVFPKAAPILLAGTGAGLALGCLLAGLAPARRRTGPAATALALPKLERPPPLASGPEASAGPDSREPSVSAAPGGGLDDVAALVATIRRLKPKDKAVVLVAGERTGPALAVALETARRLAAERAAVLVDLGETQDWLADILYREDREDPDPPTIPGLADLLAGRAGFGDVIRRDLSSTLDVVLPGPEGKSVGLDDALTAFAAAYGAVVLHASDWRSDRAKAASPFADAIAVIAPAARAEAAREAAASSLGGACPTVLAFAVRAARRTPEPVG